MIYLKNIKEWSIINENLLTAKHILKRNGITEDDDTFKELKNLLSNNMGYIGWFTKMIFVKKILFTDIINVIDIIKNDKYIIDNLPKDLVSYENYEELIDDILLIKKNRGIKLIINEMPSRIKLLITPNDYELLYQLFNNKEKDLFIKKISRYHTHREFTGALNNFLSSNSEVSFQSIINEIKSCDAELIHKNIENDIIICSVNFRQINRLGSDTSWCIVNSESTFNSYAKDYNKQYIIYLTDISGNYSKIGATIGFQFETAHLKNDSYISYDNLKRLLHQRNFNIDNLCLDSKILIDNINKISVYDILEYGLDKDFILKNKSLYKENELSNFTRGEILEYDLKNKTELDSFDSFKKLNKDQLPFISKQIIENIKRITFNIDSIDLIDMKPHPNDLMIVKQILYPESLREINYLIMSKDNPTKLLQHITLFNKFKKITKYSYGRDTSRDVTYSDGMIYAMMIGGINSYSIDKSTLLENLNLNNIYKHSAFQILDYLELNGFKFNEDDIYNFFKNFRLSTFENRTSLWISVLDKYPFMSKKLEDDIHKIYLDNSLYESELDVIKKFYPDIYQKAKDNSESIRAYDKFKRLSPYKGYMNSEEWTKNEIIRIFRDDKTRKLPSITINQLYQRLYDDYINDNLKMSDKLYDRQVVFLCVILIKLDKLDEISQFNIQWFKYLSYNSSTTLDNVINYCIGTLELFEDPNIELSDDEKGKLLSKLLTLDYEDTLKKHYSFSIVYYLKNWGFDRYINLIKNIDNDLRIKYFIKIFEYLKKNENKKEITKMVNMIFSWDMSADEKEKSIKYLNNYYIDY